MKMVVVVMSYGEVYELPFNDAKAFESEIYSQDKALRLGMDEGDWSDYRMYQIEGTVSTKVEKLVDYESWNNNKKYYKYRFILRTDNDDRMVIIYVSYTDYDDDDLKQIGDRVIAKGRLRVDRYDDTLELHTYLKCKDTDVVIDEENGGLAEDQVFDSNSYNRVELHVSTKLSNEESIIDHESVCRNMKKRNIKTFAVSDLHVSHSSLYVHRERNDKKLDLNDLKVIHAVEVELSDYKFKYDLSVLKRRMNDYILFDIESTGLNVNYDSVIEIAMIHVKNGVIVDRYESLIRNETNITSSASKVHKIKESDLADAETFSEVASDIIEFFNKSKVIVGHNIRDFDIKLLNNQLSRYEYEGVFDNKAIIDTLELAKALRIKHKKNSIKVLCNDFGIDNPNHHRAMNDVLVNKKVLDKLLELELTVHSKQLVYLNSNGNRRSFNNIIQTSHLEEIVSDKGCDRYPTLPFSQLHDELKGGLIVADSAQSIIFNLILQCRLNEAEQLLSNNYYTFIELHRIEEYEQLYKYSHTRSQIHNTINTLYELCKKYGVLICMTSNARYYDNRYDEEYYKDMYLINGNIDRNVATSIELAKNLKKVWKNLDKSNLKARNNEVIVQNPKLIADMIDNDIKLLPQGLQVPIIDDLDVKQYLKDLSKSTLEEMYGSYEGIDDKIKARFEKEIDLINENSDNNEIYYIAKKTIEYVLEQVGSRGSVASSFEARLVGITEVNALEAHYRCPNRCYHEFPNDLDSNVVGVDLPHKNCPVCGEELISDGFNLLVESFLGAGTRAKPADIDLNFSPFAQHLAMEYLKDNWNAIRCCNINKVQMRTIRARAKHLIEMLRSAESYEKLQYQNSVKTTSGQHAGGMLIIPKGHDFLEYVPLMYASNNVEKGEIVTHFEYSLLEESYMKLDILGHQTPLIGQLLEEQTGVKYLDVDYAHSNVIKAFNEAKTAGISEFGTQFAMKMLNDIKPSCFSDLIKISGLAHGTNVWLGNQQTLLVDQGYMLNDLICCRDDIMLDLMSRSIELSEAFEITNRVRKGKGLTDENETLMIERGVEDYYIDISNKIKYLFPKGHAVAYTIECARQMYYKVNHYYDFLCVQLQRIVDGGAFDFDLVRQLSKTVKNESYNPSVKGSVRGRTMTVEEKIAIIDKYVNSMKKSDIDSEFDSSDEDNKDEGIKPSAMRKMFCEILREIVLYEDIDFIDRKVEFDRCNILSSSVDVSYEINDDVVMFYIPLHFMKGLGKTSVANFHKRVVNILLSDDSITSPKGIVKQLKIDNDNPKCKLGVYEKQHDYIKDHCYIPKHELDNLRNNKDIKKTS